MRIPVRFGGEAEYQQYLKQLRAYPQGSIERLAQIKRNEKNEGPKHIALAVFHGLRDSHIKELNGLITGLLKVRNRNKAKDPAVSAKASEDLSDLRKAIETVLEDNGFDKNGRKLDQQA